MESMEEFNKLTPEEKAKYIKDETGIDIDKVEREEGMLGLQMLGTQMFIQIEESLNQQKELLIRMFDENDPKLKPLFKRALTNYANMIKMAAIEEGKFEMTNQLLSNKNS